MLNISLQARQDNTVRPIAIQIGTRTENLPQASPRHLEILETSITETAKTGNLAVVLAMLQTRAIIKGASPTKPASRKAIVLTAMLAMLGVHGPVESWPMGEKPGKVPVTNPETGEEVKDPETGETIMVDGTIEYVQTWETFAKEKGFAVEEVSASLPTARLILDLVRGDTA